MIQFLLRLVVPLLVVLLAADLLYLYTVGSWGDPSKVIEYAEVSFLIAFVILGLVDALSHLVRTFRR